jgi:calcineurin-like phosphoesterase family protein
LGDFAFYQSVAKLIELRKALNGKIYVIRGNHDDRKLLEGAGFNDLGTLVENTDGAIHFVLCHYPLLSWNRKHHGALHLFGHTHGQLEGSPGSCDIGVDSWDFTPVSVAEIVERIGQRPNRQP